MPSPNLLDTNVGCGVGSMGLSHGLELSSLNPKKKNRWLFGIPGIVTGRSPALPPRKAARPSIAMKEFEFQHLHEIIWFPLKADWKTVNLTLYDIRCNNNIIFDWLARVYDPSDESIFKPALADSITGDPNFFKIPTCTLELYSGCGEVLEQWIFENAYPNDINWGELDMDTADLVCVDFVLRYDRAFFKKV